MPSAPHYIAIAVCLMAGCQGQSPAARPQPPLDKSAVDGAPHGNASEVPARQQPAHARSSKPGSFARNGGFEESVGAPERPADWYSVRQGKVVAEPDVPQGERCLVFFNEVPGREAQAQQSFSLDGRRVRELVASLWVRARQVRPGQEIDQRAQLAIAFYDDELANVGSDRAGPWAGTFEWTEQFGRITVPPETRTAVVWIGLMGGTGEAAFDAVEIRPGRANPSALTPRRP